MRHLSDQLFLDDFDQDTLCRSATLRINSSSRRQQLNIDDEYVHRMQAREEAEAKLRNSNALYKQERGIHKVYLGHGQKRVRGLDHSIRKPSFWRRIKCLLNGYPNE